MITQALITQLQEGLRRQQDKLDMLAQELVKQKVDVCDLSNVWQVSGFLSGVIDALDYWKNSLPEE